MTLHVNMVTPQRELLRADVDQITAPSVMGEVGILPQHLPLLAQLQEGTVALFRGGDRDYYAVSGGFLEVNDDVVTILADTAESALDLNPKRSRRALKDAEAKLEELDFTDPEYSEQQARARRARARLQVAATAQH